MGSTSQANAWDDADHVAHDLRAAEFGRVGRLADEHAERHVEILQGFSQRALTLGQCAASPRGHRVGGGAWSHDPHATHAQAVNQ